MSTYRRWMKAAMKLALKLGWRVGLNGHVKFTHPNGKSVSASWSPRCPETHRVARDLRRLGLPV